MAARAPTNGSVSRSTTGVTWWRASLGLGRTSQAHKAGAKVGLCGQAPSDHPEFADFLVDCGIDLISVSPDSFIVVKQHVAAKEAAASGIRGGARQGGGGTRRSSRGSLRSPGL